MKLLSGGQSGVDRAVLDVAGLVPPSTPLPSDCQKQRRGCPAI